MGVFFLGLLDLMTMGISKHIQTVKEKEVQFERGPVDEFQKWIPYLNIQQPLPLQQGGVTGNL